MGTKNYSSYSDMITFSRASTGTYLDSDGLLKSAATNTPHVEYDYQGNRLGLLVEEARTNLLTYSEDFTQWSQSQVTILSNAIEAPDGTLTATKTIEDQTSNYHYVEKTFSGVGNYTYSIFLKAAERKYAGIHIYDGSAARGCSIDLETGTLGTPYGGATASVTSFPSGWWRLSVAVTTTGSGKGVVYSSTSNALAGYLGDGASGVYIYGAQVEAGTFPTSYIPTSGATATRSADVASIGVGAFGYNKTAGTVLVEFDSASLSNSTIYSFDDGSSAQGNTALIYPANGITYQVVSVGSTAVNTTFDDYKTANKVSKVATCYRANDFAAVLNGGTIATDSSGALPTVTQLRLGNYVGGGTTFDMTGHISSIAYYPRRLTDAQIKALTSPPETPTLSLTFDDSSTSYLETSIHG